MTTMGERGIGHLDEVLENLGVFRADPEDLIQSCPSGFRRVPISQGPDFYISLQALGPDQVAPNTTITKTPKSVDPNSVATFEFTGEDNRTPAADLTFECALDGTAYNSCTSRGRRPLGSGSMVGRAAAHPHGFRAGGDGLYMLSIQLPRPAEGGTTWDEPGTTTDPAHCPAGGRCRRCARCGGHSAEVRRGSFECENCGQMF